MVLCPPPKSNSPKRSKTPASSIRIQSSLTSAIQMDSSTSTAGSSRLPIIVEINSSTSATSTTRQRHGTLPQRFKTRGKSTPFIGARPFPSTDRRHGKRKIWIVKFAFGVRCQAETSKRSNAIRNRNREWQCHSLFSVSPLS